MLIYRKTAMGILLSILGQLVGVSMWQPNPPCDLVPVVNTLICKITPLMRCDTEKGMGLVCCFNQCDCCKQSKCCTKKGCPDDEQGQCSNPLEFVEVNPDDDVTDDDDSDGDGSDGDGSDGDGSDGDGSDGDGSDGDGSDGDGSDGDGSDDGGRV